MDKFRRGIYMRRDGHLTSVTERWATSGFLRCTSFGASPEVHMVDKTTGMWNNNVATAVDLMSRVGDEGGPAKETEMEPTTSVFLKQIAKRLRNLADGNYEYTFSLREVNEIIAQLDAESHRVANHEQCEILREIRSAPPVIVDQQAVALSQRVPANVDEIIQQGANRAVNALFAASAIDRAVLDAALTYIEMGDSNAAT